MKRRMIAAIVWVFALMAACCGVCETPDDVPLVVLDCDMGCWNDAAMALSLLLKAEEAGELRILGITLEGGNQFIDASYENYGEIQPSALRSAREFLAAVGREDLPIFTGTDLPMGYGADDAGELAGFFASLRYLQDSDSYGAVHFYENLAGGALTDRNDARDFLLSCAEQYPHRVTVLAIGPTMNLARAVEADDSFAGKIAAVYYMAGAFGEPYEAFDTDGKPVSAIGGANITPYAEYNACYDARSLEICLTAGFPEQYLLPGEVNAGMDEATLAEFEAANADGDLIAELWLARYRAGLPDYPYWDPVTAAAFLEPERLRGEIRYVTVNTDRSDERYAMTTAISAEEYASRSAEEQARYGKAFVSTGYDGFWDCAIEWLCR